MQMKRPIAVPSQTWGRKSQNVSAKRQAKSGLAIFWGGAAEYLSNELFMRDGILLGAERLLQEREEHGHNDACFQSLPEDNEEDWTGRQYTVY
jgi:hypothetical protein